MSHKKAVTRSPEDELAYQALLAILKDPVQKGKPQQLDALKALAFLDAKYAKQPDKAKGGKATVGRQGTEAQIRCIDGVESKPIEWLWPGRIACGKLSLIAGDPGLGKSQVMAALAATVTTGGQFPVDGARCEPGAVLFVCAEDDVADTIRSRLDAAGADVSRCYILDGFTDTDEKGNVRHRLFNLGTDVDRLHRVVRQIGNVRMVVIDPISAYLGGVDSHKNTDVREILNPLGTMASLCGLAIVGVSHLNKANAQSALQRVSGSLAFVATARSTLLVVRDKANRHRRLLLPLKNNLAPEDYGFAFAIASVTQGNGIISSRVEWEAEAVTVTADEAMFADTDERNGQLQTAKQFLAELLANGPVKAKEAEKASLEAGIAWITLQRAKKALGIVSQKEGKGPFKWVLPMFINPENPPPREKHDNHDNHCMDAGFQPPEKADLGNDYHRGDTRGNQKNVLLEVNPPVKSESTEENAQATVMNPI